MKTDTYCGKPKPFKDLSSAKLHGALYMRNLRFMIIYSDHPDNKQGDYFIDDPDVLIRSWEQVYFTGYGHQLFSSPTEKISPRELRAIQSLNSSQL